MYSVVGVDGQLYGPADINTLKQWCAEGRITPITNLVDPVTGRTLRASDLPDFAGVFAPQAAPQPQAPTFQQPNYSQNPYPFQNPPGPVQVNNYYGTAVYGPSPRSKIAAGLLAIFLGGFGIHRFYLGYNAIGVIMLLLSLVGGMVTCGITSAIVGVWALVEGIVIFCGGLNDAEGRPLVN